MGVVHGLERPAPLLGQHGAGTLRELYSDRDEIEGLAAENVIGDRPEGVRAGGDAAVESDPSSLGFGRIDEMPARANRESCRELTRRRPRLARSSSVKRPQHAGLIVDLPAREGRLHIAR